MHYALCAFPLKYTEYEFFLIHWPTSPCSVIIHYIVYISFKIYWIWILHYTLTNLPPVRSCHHWSEPVAHIRPLEEISPVELESHQYRMYVKVKKKSVGVESHRGIEIGCWKDGNGIDQASFLDKAEFILCFGPTPPHGQSRVRGLIKPSICSQ